MRSLFNIKFIIMIFIMLFSNISVYSLSTKLIKVIENKNSIEIKIKLKNYPEIIQKPSVEPNNIFVWTFLSNLSIRKEEIVKLNSKVLNYVKLSKKNNGKYCLIINTNKKCIYSEKISLTKTKCEFIITLKTSKIIENNYPKNISYIDLINITSKKYNLKKKPKIGFPDKIENNIKPYIPLKETVKSSQNKYVDNKIKENNEPDFELVFFNKNKKKKNTKKKIVVVIDAGHGGKDPGAISNNGVFEKNITLDIALKIKSLFSSNENIKVVLTRSKDIYIPLIKRREIARKSNASLFISIHADASDNKYARGSSVFILSKKGSTDHISKILARTHDKAEKEFGEQIPTDNSTVMGILFDLKNSYNSKESLKLGEYVLSYMEDLLKIKSRGVKSAPFSVLKLLNVPSILVETAFLSNEQDERLLNSNKFRMKMAYCIYNGILKYFKPISKNKLSPIVHKVKKGDSLWKIAKKYSVKISSIVKINGLRNDILRPDSKIIIPYF